jgi:condensin-2 complex subunit D3
MQLQLSAQGRPPPHTRPCSRLPCREVAAQEPGAPSWEFLQARWAELQGRGGGDAGAGGEGEGRAAEEGAQLLLVISHAAEKFPAAQAQHLAADLLKVGRQRPVACCGPAAAAAIHLHHHSHHPHPTPHPPQAILSFSLPAPAAAAHVAALHKLSAAPAEGGSAGACWCAAVYQEAGALLGGLVGARQRGGAASQRRAAVALFTVGEVALLRAAKVPGSLTLLVQALTSEKLLPGAGAGASHAQASGQVGRGMSACTPADRPPTPSQLARRPPRGAVQSGSRR